MKHKLNKKSVLSTCLALGVSALTSFTNFAGDEGSHSKSKSEGSHSKHSHEGSHSQKQHREGSGTAGDKQKMMRMMQEYATPGKHHEHLNILEGKWKHEVKWWMSPNEKPEISHGTSDIHWIMGKRFVQHMVKGIAMGQPFEGMGMIGYDNAKKEYNSIWIDSMGTGIMKGTGQFDTKEKSLLEKGSFTCPFRQESKFRSITKIIDDDHFSYVMYGPDMATGNEYKAMEIIYTREK